MESKTTAPSFTVSLRGYDRMEVDEYLDSLAEALGQVEEAEERNRVMQAHMDRMIARVAELEERINGDVPKSGAVLGERIAIILRSAEEAAADTVARAEAHAAELLGQARDDVASAEDQARGAILRGEEQARRIESAARAEATEIVAEAEARASTRTRQIEQWAEQVVSHTRAEEARMLSDQQEKRERGESELQALEGERRGVATILTELRDTLGQALGLVGPVATQPADAPVVEEAVNEADDSDESGDGNEADDGEAERAEGQTEAEEDGKPEPVQAIEADVVAAMAADDDVDEEVPWPSAFNPVESEAAEVDPADRTGEIEAVNGSGEPDEFDTKFDAWVNGSGEPQHFRRL
jgi:DivIVA domain-containing protein